MKPEHDAVDATVQRAEATASAEPSDGVDVELRTDTVLSVVEADQLVAAKEHPALVRGSCQGASVSSCGACGSM